MAHEKQIERNGYIYTLVDISDNQIRIQKNLVPCFMGYEGYALKAVKKIGARKKPKPETLRVTEAAQLLKIDRRTLYDYIWAGKLTKIDRGTVLKKDVMRLLKC